MNEGEALTLIDDALATLDEKSIARRSEGVRTLSLHGDWEHIPRLLELARDDRSPAVRFLSCAGCADILSRFRIGKYARKFKTADREGLVPMINRIDPGQSPAIFSVMACLDFSPMLDRLIVGLRDPRGNVRLGAAVGLWRYVISSSQNGNAALESRIIDVISDTRIPSDSLAELGRICAAAGYVKATASLGSIHLEGVHAELTNRCIDILEELPSIGLGLWWSDGRDGGEVSAKPLLPSAGMLVVNDGALIAERGRWKWMPKRSLRLRRKFFRRVGQAEASHVLQDSRRTWFQSSSTVLDIVDLGLDVPRLKLGFEAQVEGARAQHLLSELQPDSSSGHRARGLLSLAAGEQELALAEFRMAIEKSKTPPDTWFLLGEVLHVLGDHNGAQDAWTLAVEKAKRKKDWQVIRARERLALKSD